MNAARDAMLKGSVNLSYATESAEAAEFRSYSGALEMHQAATRYRTRGGALRLFVMGATRAGHTHLSGIG
jgi:hypothetical protein